MFYLITGVILWSALHFMPAIPAGIRSKLIKRTDVVVYKGVFALVIVLAVLLMVMGWKATPRVFAFQPPAWGVTVNLVFMLATSVLLLAPYLENNFKRILRHPQLTGFVLWGAGHVLATGQVRSLVLFGGLSVWAFVEMLLINRRDGPWQKPKPVSALADFRLLLAGMGFFILFMFTHLRLFGVSPVPTWY
jgi:uncharacterized membrane protein